MDKTYAIADIHGRFDLLTEAIKGIKSIEPEGNYTLVTLGDYIDRGPDSRKVIELLMKGPDDGSTWIHLQGNHEDMMIQCLEGRADRSWWLRNGGDKTLKSYGHSLDMLGFESPIPKAHIDWIKKLPLYFVRGTRIFVHAGVDNRKPIFEHMKEELQWWTYPENFNEPYLGLHVVHGHQFFLDGPKLYKHRSNLDCGAFKTGKLAVAQFDEGLVHDDLPYQAPNIGWATIP